MALIYQALVPRTKVNMVRSCAQLSVLFSVPWGGQLKGQMRKFSWEGTEGVVALLF